MRSQIAWRVLQASTLSSMAHHPTQRASTVREELIWRQVATMRCPIVLNVMQVSTQASMAHHPTKRA